MTAIIVVFFAAYSYLLKQPAYPATVMPITWPDRLISFQPLALPLYFSQWFYVSLPPALLATRQHVMVDVVAGVALGSLAASLSLRLSSWNMVM